MTHLPPAVVWIRHGTSVDGLERPDAHARPGTPLSDYGRAETRRTAAAVRELDAERILASPLPRARETAQILAAELGIPLGEPYPQLQEWQAPDCVLGLAPVDYPEDYCRWRRTRVDEPDSALPGGESLAAFARRAATVAELVDAIAADTGGTVLVVTHTLLIGAVAGYTAGIREPAAVFAAATRFVLSPAGIWAGS